MSCRCRLPAHRNCKTPASTKFRSDNVLIGWLLSGLADGVDKDCDEGRLRAGATLPRLAQSLRGVARATCCATTPAAAGGATPAALSLAQGLEGLAATRAASELELRCRGLEQSVRGAARSTSCATTTSCGSLALLRDHAVYELGGGCHIGSSGSDWFAGRRHAPDLDALFFVDMLVRTW